MTEEVVTEEEMSNTGDSQEFSILVVDDAPENVMLLSLILEELGSISSALGGQEAIDKALDDPPDLIVLDIKMPEINGYDVIEALKADQRTEDVPVIFVTGLSDETDEEKGLELGAIDYITKPYNPLVVTARVRNHLRYREHDLRLGQMTKEVEQLATTDLLTSVYNRWYFISKLEDELERVRSNSHSSSLLLIDVDCFKSINYTYGQDVGDTVLAHLATLFENHVRQLDMVARTGGTEFAILLPETGREECLVSAERLLAAVRETSVEAADETLRFTISIGCTEFDHDCSNVDDALKAAHLALDSAKQSGRDRVVVRDMSELA